ncbi:MAG: hypothetical protein JWN37_863 [Candidatus Nomurabacteria bacterium]|nr:hypothetical protein [Candidatus Nomurabacteria bacterium]
MRAIQKRISNVYPLIRIDRENFLFHGSPWLLSKVEPRKAICTTGIPENNLNAIYATTSSGIAILHAVLRIRSKHGYLHWGLRNRKVIVTGRNVRYRTGYVYVLPREYFAPVRNGLFYVATTPIIPYKIFRVEPQMLHEYFDMEINTDVPCPH